MFFEHCKRPKTAEKYIIFKLKLKIILREDYGINLHYNIEQGKWLSI